MNLAKRHALQTLILMCTFFTFSSGIAGPYPCRNGELKEFVLYTCPKTGTHLMLPLLINLTGKTNVGLEAFPRLKRCSDYDLLDQMNLDPNFVQMHWIWPHYPLPIGPFNDTMNKIAASNRFYYRHIPYTPPMEEQMIKRGTTVFHVLRDPRDFVVSLLNHQLNLGVFLFDNPMWFLSLSTDEQIKWILLGTTRSNSAGALIREFIPWRNSPVCCVLRFEKLMGIKGGAYDTETQLAELRKISDALDLEISDEELLKVFEKSYGTSRYFHKGIVGTWRDYFNEENKQLFKDLLGDLVIELGYEQDNNW